MVSFSEIESYCRGKRLALVGNSRGLLDRADGPAIDAHDVVVRMNHGYPRPGTVGSTGRRTDLWICSFNNRQRQIAEKPLFGARYILHLPRDKTHLDPGLGPELYSQEPVFHDVLERLLGGHPPSTGCMAAYFFIERIRGLKEVRIYGFDFFQRPNFFLAGGAPFHDRHNPEAERHFLTDFVARYGASWAEPGLPGTSSAA